MAVGRLFVEKEAHQRGQLRRGGFRRVAMRMNLIVAVMMVVVEGVVVTVLVVVDVNVTVGIQVV
jgi:hypothetical protein